MRLASLILSAMFLLGLSITALGYFPGDIAVPSMSIPNMDMPKPIPKPNMDMPEPKSKPLNEAATTTINQTGNMSSNQTQSAKDRQEAQPMDGSGKWLIKLDAAPDRTLDLTLWSAAESAKIMGFGLLTEEGSEDSVTAVGSVTGQEMRLTVRSATSEYSSKKSSQFEFRLIMENNTMSGTYSRESGGKMLAQGNATATRR